ncbi:DUF3854 domain-containing protein [Nostoc parmelioides]|uniref:DUF3854 domain-containing protein n=1 Tax=Nostoc parmelioides FACHB-3921 TaxID=2692909 RepID=A0ABR8BLH8_9NOSO|nr:DUF3854 domain-containing protein [Nostoc parmelioides]MBD2254735.1 DUF3854 domain-containing protein [Nostoc parmelioides FACHB-3921]
MFDERSVNIFNNYTVLSQEDFHNNLKIWNQAIVPLIETSLERLKYEWDKRAKIEIGDETYVLKPNESGGYSWAKIDPSLDLEWDFEGEELEVSSTSFTSRASTSESTQPTTSAQTPLKSTVTTEAEQSETSTPNATQTPASPSQPTQPPVSSGKETTPPTTATQPPLISTPTQSKASSVSVCPPEHIDPNHWQELVEKSAIAPDIAQMNFQSLHFSQARGSHEAWDRLMISDKLPRTNTGRLSNEMLKTYSYLDSTDGWWCNAGVDPRSFLSLTPGETAPHKEWGCYKPDQPRPKKDEDGQIIEGKFIKYEHPPKTQLSTFLLDVPDDIAAQVYQRAGVDPTESDRQSGFWYCVWKHHVPVIVTEGAKKAASILSFGHAAIGLPGINAGYRSKDEQGNLIQPQLREEFAMFATPKRDIKFCFDHDTRLKTVANVHKAQLRTGKLLQETGAKVSIMTLPGPDKGVDDFTVNNGQEKFEALVNDAQSLEEWEKNNPLPDLRLTIQLKNGQVLKLYEKLKDGTVKQNPANLSPEQVAQAIPTGVASPSSPELQQPQSNTEQAQQDEQGEQGKQGENVPDDFNSHLSPSLRAFQPTTVATGQKYWAAKQKVPNYAQTLPRKFLKEKENEDIVTVAKKLLDKYGQALDDGSTVYRSDAFTIRKFKDTYSIHRAGDEKESYFSNSLMQFEMNKKGEPVIKNSETLLMIERQEFLNVNQRFQSVTQLPSFYEDAITLKSHLGSLAPLGTQDVVKKLEISEVAQLLNHTLKTAQSRHLQIGDYRLKSEADKQTGEELVKLSKKESDGLYREAVRINLSTNEALVMRIGGQDLENLRLIAKRVQLEYSPQNKSPNTVGDLSPKQTPQYRHYQGINNKSKSNDIEL